MYVYVRSSERGSEIFYTVGFYGPDGFVPESDHPNKAEAAERVHYLNGGAQAGLDVLNGRLAEIAGLAEDIRDSSARIARNV